MSVSHERLFPQRHPAGLAGKVVQFPLARIVVAALFILPFLLFHNTVIGDLIAATSEPSHSLLVYVDGVASFVVILLLYRLYTRTVEGRRAYEISGAKAPAEFGVGVLISLGMVGLMVALMSALGYYEIDQVGSSKILLDSVFLFGMGALLQELFFRILLFRLVEELVGSWLALLAVAATFGLAHLANENATPWTSAALAISDVLLTAAFIFTRRLWFVWGLHMGWNFAQDGIFGMPNSGVTELASWIRPVIEGPNWVTGGSFGIEGSPIVVFLSLAIGIVILRRAAGENQIILPAWKRRAHGRREPGTIL